MEESTSRLILFTRFPRVGQVKTRLVPALGAEGATALHRRLTEHALTQARQLTRTRSVALLVHYAGGDPTRMAAWLGAGQEIRPQGEGDLGKRLERAFGEAFTAGYRSTVIMGSDCPELSTEILAQAFDALEGQDLVLGPAADGGYYLIGLRRHVPQLFAGIPWGTAGVLAGTLEIAARLSLACHHLPMLADVDRPEDLLRAHAFLTALPTDTSNRIIDARPP